MRTTGHPRTARLARALAVLGVALLAALGVAQELVISVGAGVDKRDRPVLTADVHAADGTPVTSRSVSFYLIPAFFPNGGARVNGAHPVLLTTTKTNVAGHAEKIYTPPYSGAVMIEAKVEGANGSPGGSARAQLDVVRPDPPDPPSSTWPLASVVGPFQSGVLIAVLALWALMLGLLAFTTVRIAQLGRRGGPQTASETPPAPPAR